MLGILKDIKNNKVATDREVYTVKQSFMQRKMNLGLWGEKKPIAPWKWRKIRK